MLLPDLSPDDGHWGHAWPIGCSESALKQVKTVYVIQVGECVLVNVIVALILIRLIRIYKLLVSTLLLRFMPGVVSLFAKFIKYFDRHLFLVASELDVVGGCGLLCRLWGRRRLRCFLITNLRSLVFKLT